MARAAGIGGPGSGLVREWFWMSKIKQFVGALKKDESGATMVEYALMLALIAIVSLAAVTALGLNVQTAFTNISGAIAAAI